MTHKAICIRQAIKPIFSLFLYKSTKNSFNCAYSTTIILYSNNEEKKMEFLPEYRYNSPRYNNISVLPLETHSDDLQFWIVLAMILGLGLGLGAGISLGYAVPNPYNKWD